MLRRFPTISGNAILAPTKAAKPITSIFAACVSFGVGGQDSDGYLVKRD
jgi:hypothetical protein